MHEKQVSKNINMSLLTVYSEEKEHASTSCFGMWGAQRHITAATRCASPSLAFGAMLGLARWFSENVLTALRQIGSLTLANFVLPRRYMPLRKEMAASCRH
jgi:hypothetical protein